MLVPGVGQLPAVVVRRAGPAHQPSTATRCGKETGRERVGGREKRKEGDRVREAEGDR